MSLMNIGSGSVRRASADDEGTLALAVGLVADARELIEAHVASLRLEIDDGLAAVARNVTRMASALVAAGVAAVLLGLAAVAGLAAAGMPAWLAHLLVGVVLLAIAAALVLRTALELRRRRPVRRLVRAIRETAEGDEPGEGADHPEPRPPARRTPPPRPAA
jgi:hypothetical protein